MTGVVLPAAALRLCAPAASAADTSFLANLAEFLLSNLTEFHDACCFPR
jgi:hypothetical protein